VIAPANTGNDNNNKTAVIKTAQTNKGVRCKYIPRHLILIIVDIKLIAPKMDEIPAKCKLKIAKSTELPVWAGILESGGYTVQPVPAPVSTNPLRIKSNNAGGNNQKEILLSLAKAMSGAPIKTGTKKFPKPPIKIGITKKKIIIKA
jgi:hypothetical protein